MKYRRILVSEGEIFADAFTDADEIDFSADPTDGFYGIEGISEIPGIADIKIYASAQELPEIGPDAGMFSISQSFAGIPGNKNIALVENGEIPKDARPVSIDELPDDVKAQLAELIKNTLPQLTGLDNYAATYDAEKMKPMKEVFAAFSKLADDSGVKIKYKIGDGFKTRGDIIVDGENLVFKDPKVLSELEERAKALHFMIYNEKISLDIVFRDIGTLSDEHGNTVSEEELFENGFRAPFDGSGFDVENDETLLPCATPGMFWKIETEAAGDICGKAGADSCSEADGNVCDEPSQEQVYEVLKDILRHMDSDNIEYDEDVIKKIAKVVLDGSDVPDEIKEFSFEDKFRLWLREMDFLFADIRDPDLTIDMVSEEHLKRLADIYEEILGFGIESDDNREVGFEIDTTENTTTVYSISAGYSWDRDLGSPDLFKIANAADEIRFSVVDDSYKSITVMPGEKFIKSEFVFRGLKKSE